MIPYRPEQIWVQEASLGDAITREILAKLSGIPCSSFRRIESILPELRSAADHRTAAKIGARFLDGVIVHVGFHHDL